MSQLLQDNLLLKLTKLSKTVKSGLEDLNILQGIDLEIDSVDMINQLVVREYMNEYHGLSGYQ